jgi:hypothetical protein
MMKPIETGLLGVALLNCLPALAILAATPAEQKYLETRDNFIRQFSTAKSPQDGADQKALLKLQEQLQSIIGPIDVPHFPKRGKISLATLQQDYGFGQVDGLLFRSGHEDVLFVTTKGLLNAYLAQHKELQTDLSNLAKSEEFYSLALNFEAAVTRFADISLRMTRDNSVAFAFLGLWAQDIGPFPPTHLFVFLANDDRVFVVSAEAQNHIDQIAECKNLWETLNQKLNDQKPTDDTAEKQNFTAYCRCFGEKAKTEPFFKDLTE